LLVGLLSAAHCIGMCGGIAGALGFSLPGRARGQRRRFLSFILAYNGGRVLSYGIAGGLLGSVGMLVNDGWVLLGVLLRVGAAVVTVALGLYLMGIFPRLAHIERFGEPLWRRIEPLGRRLLPVQTLHRAFAVGMVWGWLPCGLVYAALLNTPAQGGPIAGAVYMTAFGIGTLPVMAGSGLMAAGLRGLFARRAVAILGGGLIVVLGLYSLFSQGI
jgi:hypothetical protein